MLNEGKHRQYEQQLIFNLTFVDPSLCSLLRLKLNAKSSHWINATLQTFAYRLNNTTECSPPSIHYVPSHIEKTSIGLRRAENSFADILATRCVSKSKQGHQTKSNHDIQEDILTKTIIFIEVIEDKLWIFQEADDPSAAADDLGACTYANRDPLTRAVP